MDPFLPGRYGKMTAAEWDREVEKFDQEFIADQATPLTKSLRARIDRAKKHGRAMLALRTQRIGVTIARELLGRADRYAKRHRMTRSEVIAAGLRILLKKAG